MTLYGLQAQEDALEGHCVANKALDESLRSVAFLRYLRKGCGAVERDTIG